MQLVDGGGDFGRVHFVHLDALPDGFEQGDGQFAAEMFPEFFKAGEDGQPVGVIGAEQFIGCSNPDGKAVYANASRIADGIVNPLERD